MNKDFNVEIQKQMPAKAADVFAAWTQPEQLKKWWKPMNEALTEVTNDVKQGGAVTYVFDTGITISGEYKEVEENKKLVYGWNWKFPKDAIKNSQYTLTVTFTDEGEGSTLHVLQQTFKDEESTLPHKQGWEKGLNDLAAYLEENKTSDSSNTVKDDEAMKDESDDRSGGYNEEPEQGKVGGG